MGLKEVSSWIGVFQNNMGYLVLEYRRFKDSVNK